MIVSFQTTPPPIEETAQFEAVYPEGLQIPPDEKAEILSGGYHVWLRVNGTLAGEMYGVLAADDEDRVPDIEPTDFYIGKFTILPEFQKKGLGKLLFTYTLAMLGNKFKRISWHATSPGMNLISDLFGAKTGPTHLNWYGTFRPAFFRYLEIP